MAERRSDLMDFLNKNGCFVRARRPPSEQEPMLTHTLMDGQGGGKIALRPELLEGFYHAYGCDLRQGKRLFVVERHSVPCFNMHFDVDFHSLNDEQRVLEFCRLLYEATAEFFSRPLFCVVCAVLDGNRKERAGNGLHVLFPRTPVTEEQALQIRAGVVARCMQKLTWTSDWDKILDICVLSNRSGGLRMVGSDKCRRCAACHNYPENRACCSACERKGYVAEDRIYWPWRVLPETDEHLQQLQLMENPAYAAKLCSTRSGAEKPRADFAPPPTAPAPSLRLRQRENGRLQRNDEGHVFMLRSGDGGEHRGFEPVELPEAARAALLVEVNAYAPEYAQLQVRRVLRNRARDAALYLVKVGGFGERHCTNKGAPHRSQTIYFQISRQGVLAQRCYSEKTSGDCCCRDFVGKGRPLPAALRVALFGPDPEPRRRPQPFLGAF